jgi:hypothetical protein
MMSDILVHTSLSVAIDIVGLANIIEATEHYHEGL